MKINEYSKKIYKLRISNLKNQIKYYQANYDEKRRASVEDFLLTRIKNLEEMLGALP